ncbi:MAG: hypothetical protein GQ544_03645 [Candidatus Aminicenantes bacterium]|nr:hypothetical protein [Candidatus Aminicenantes bacterium]
MPGLNSEILRDEVYFLVQTQDKAPGANYVESIVYQSGQVLSSRRTFYTHLLDCDDLPERIKALIQSQHKSILEEISQGKFDTP